MQELGKEAAKKYFGEIWDDLIGYLKIYDFIKLKAISAYSGAIKVPSIQSFWYSILGDKFAGDTHRKYLYLRNGDILRFHDVFLAEWAPKLPGRIWTHEGIKDFDEGQKLVDGYVEFNNKVYKVLRPWGKERVVSAGFGSIRTSRRTRDDDHFMYMSLVSKENWHCDYGIPVVVSRSVYEKFCKYSGKGVPWLRTVEGVLHIGEDLPFRELVPRAIGAKLSPETEDTLRYRSGLPRCYIYVSSPLSMKAAYNVTHPNATAWTMFQSRYPSQTVWNRYPSQPFMYTYTMFNPSSPVSIEEAIKFIKLYVRRYDGKKIITDFDGIQPHLDASIPLNVHPLRARKKEVKKLIVDYDKWVKKTVR